MRLAPPHSETDPDAPAEMEERRRVEIGALVFGALLAGALLAYLLVWLTDDEVTRQQTRQFVFMALTSGSMLGIFLSVVAGNARRVNAEVSRSIRREHARLRLAAETNTQQGMAPLRSVAFAVQDARVELDDRLTRVCTVVADTLERGGMAGVADVTALREEVDRAKEGVAAVEGRLRELTRDFAESQVARIHGRAAVPNSAGRAGRRGTSGEADHS